MPQAANLLSESTIREALLLHLRHRLGKDDVLIEELGVEHGAARVDVALLSDQLLGFEIKSDFDNLDRLARQMHTYHRVFDSLTLVTTASYINQAEALLPIWWGIIEATHGESGEVVMKEKRRATAHNRQEAASLAALLWRDEAYGFLINRSGPVVKAKAPRHAIYEAIAKVIPLEHIRAEVIATLQARDSMRPRSHAAV